MAGDEGFEPPNGGTRTHCLTTWRIPNGLKEILIHLFKKCKNAPDIEARGIPFGIGGLEAEGLQARQDNAFRVHLFAGVTVIQICYIGFKIVYVVVVVDVGVISHIDAVKRKYRLNPLSPIDAMVAQM